MWLSLMLPLIASSQTDSLKCITVKDYRAAINKMAQGRECAIINTKLQKQVVLKDSTIKAQDELLDEVREKFELANIIYQQEKDKRQQAEKEAEKYRRRGVIWKGTTILATLAAAVFYLLPL